MYINCIIKIIYNIIKYYKTIIINLDVTRLILYYVLLLPNIYYSIFSF